MSDILPPGLSDLSINQSSQDGSSRTQLGQEEFFELMVAQLQNQDPLNPSDSNEFLGQVAQFSTVSSTQNIEASLAQLTGALQSNQALQASTLVGRQVLVPGSRVPLEAGGSLSGAVDLPQSTSDLTVSIYDARGQLVRQIPLGPQPAGLTQFTWDGFSDAGEPLPQGTYNVVANYTAGDQRLAAEPLVVADVESVTLGGGADVQLNLAGIGPVTMGQVRQLL